LQANESFFQSKNNKAVDVVVERLNNLTATPLILRLGDSSRMEALASFLQKILMQHQIRSKHSIRRS